MCHNTYDDRIGMLNKTDRNAGNARKGKEEHKLTTQLRIDIPKLSDAKYKNRVLHSHDYTG